MRGCHPTRLTRASRSAARVGPAGPAGPASAGLSCAGGGGWPVTFQGYVSARGLSSWLGRTIGLNPPAAVSAPGWTAAAGRSPATGPKTPRRADRHAERDTAQRDRLGVTLGDDMLLLLPI